MANTPESRRRTSRRAAAPQVRDSGIEWQEPIYGNVVPEILPEEPEKRPARRKPAAPRRRVSRSVRRNRERMAWIGLPYCLFLFGTVLMLLASCVGMLSVKSDINAARKVVAAYETELRIAKADNDAREISLEKSVDINKIYRTAVDELGMTYPASDQIIYYNDSSSGHVIQNDEIPTD